MKNPDEELTDEERNPVPPFYVYLAPEMLLFLLGMAVVITLIVLEHYKWVDLSWLRND